MSRQRSGSASIARRSSSSWWSRPRSARVADGRRARRDAFGRVVADVPRRRPRASARRDSSRAYCVGHEVLVGVRRQHRSRPAATAPANAVVLPELGRRDLAPRASASSCRCRSASGTSAWNAWASRSVGAALRDDRVRRRTARPTSSLIRSTTAPTTSIDADHRLGCVALHRGASSIASAESRPAAWPICSSIVSSCAGVVLADGTRRGRAAASGTPPPARRRRCPRRALLELRHQSSSLAGSPTMSSSSAHRRSRRARAARPASAAAMIWSIGGAASPCFSRSTSA